MDTHPLVLPAPHPEVLHTRTNTNSSPSSCYIVEVTKIKIKELLFYYTTLVLDSTPLPHQTLTLSSPTLNSAFQTFHGLLVNLHPAPTSLHLLLFQPIAT